MSDTAASANDSSAPAFEATVPGRRFCSRQRTLLGLNLQDGIRYFFGGNATVAIIILVLICGFLLREAFFFFPDHHKELERFRLSGLEFVALIDGEVSRHSEVMSQLRQAYYQEINSSSAEEQKVVEAYGALKRHVSSEVESLDDRVKSFQKRREDALFDLEIKEPALKKKQDAGEPIPPALAQSVREGKALVANLDGRIELAEARLHAGIADTLRLIEPSDVEGAPMLPATAWTSVVRGVGEELISGEKPIFIAAIEDVIKERQATAQEQQKDFKAAIDQFNAGIRPLKGQWSELRNHVIETKNAAVAFETAPERIEALRGFAAAATDPEEKARRLAEANAVKQETVDFSARAQKIYAAVEAHTTANLELREEATVALADLPEQAGSETATETLEAGRKTLQEYPEYLEQQQERIAEWKHDKSYSVIRSIFAFFVGTEWVTNSSWQDFYGLVPLFVGSLLIAIIAILVSMPFAVGAAIYVNQLATRGEQTAIKPIIEFIGAIPSVVLGFFGILVLGTTLREISQIEALSWIPGFPMAERLNILTAGLLLAFMAVPTIFTLAEDAINNVPQAFTEGSLALGASKLQTVVGVIVPTAMSGIVAAILLGFGRIIGETMVVLLVAGNKIAIPDFSKGLGVATEPAHTMTGIIAQELGEVDAGSLHWRALFMVGMVLFTVSLLINYFAQRTIKRFQSI
jgi:phosphate transport system permease protein